MNNRKKKKGFTLIELIAVIAILAILGVILVPKISGYSTKATMAKDLANAKQLLQAIEMYNSDAANESSQISTDTDISKDSLSKYISSWPGEPKTAVSKANAGTSVDIVTTGNTPTTWDTMKYSDLQAYAAYLQTKQ